MKKIVSGIGVLFFALCMMCTTHYSVKQTIYVPANATRSLPILNMKADEKYALKFYPKSDFDGYIYGM